MTAVGVDACKKGWIAVALHQDGPVRAHHLPTIGELSTKIPDAQVVAIDIPIGLPETGRRLADIEARQLLGSRRNSLFWTPVRPALEASSHANATAVSQQLTGHGISQQAYALGPKIFEVESWLATAPYRVCEVHPELSFTYLMGKPARSSKKTWAGMVERRDALASAGIDLDAVSGDAATQSGIDDLLDAAAAAWTARRLLTGEALSIPDHPDTDASGRTIAIWA